MKRTFLYSDDKSSKFWDIEIDGNSFTVNYGKAGTNGQTQTKDFADDAACQKAAEKLIAEKTKKGYVEQGGDTSAPVASVATEKPKKSAEPKAAKPKEDKPKETKQATATTNMANGEKRTFLFNDDKSSKFWDIEINGSSFTVNYGKVGTGGQTQTKDFADDAACQKAAEKLIAEKTKKGYVEEVATEAPAIEGLQENQIVVDLTNTADMKRILNMLINDVKHWNSIVEKHKGLEYGKAVNGAFEAFDSNGYSASEEVFFEAAAKQKELLPLIEKYINAVDPNQFFRDEIRMGMNAVYQLALNNEKYIPFFIDHHRKVRPGGGIIQMDHIMGLLSDSDNGLKLLAACAMYAIDQPDIEHNLEPWIEEYIDEDSKLQKKLFKYIMLEAANMPGDSEFRNDYVMEVLDIMGIEYEEDILEEILDDLDPEDLPKIKDLIE